MLRQSEYVIVDEADQNDWISTMFGYLRRLLTDPDALQRQIKGNLQEIEERLSQRMLAIEQRLDENEQVLRRLGHQVARIEGRTSFPNPADLPPGSKVGRPWGAVGTVETEPALGPRFEVISGTPTPLQQTKPL
ncbi:hypothetical protein [Methylobacterium persicinum]|uniref:hypothetical protein n=1 Tax=Methylobacterium persicinum TaxID=374426 RepID=UPI001EE31A34|nr:hypothetical protein [Methylobacterium persicinum]